MAPPKKRRRYILTGLLTVIPLWVTWLVLSFLFQLLSSVGQPAVHYLSAWLSPRLPEVADVLKSEWCQHLLSVILVLAFLYGLGLLATWVIGRRVLSLFETLLEQIPFVKSIYGATKKLVAVLREGPGTEEVQRVVLINFPSTEMKTVGLVTRTLKDADTGKLLAAVYVPTTPNPTSGYLEIVPVDKITSTNWTLDEAMSFIVSGGATSPAHMNYEFSHRRADLPKDAV